MSQIITTRELTALGFNAADLNREVRAGRRRRVRRGAYAPAPACGSVEESHRQLIAATTPQLWREGVLSHGSAAVLHGLPVRPPQVAAVHLTRTRTGGGRRRSVVEVHTSPLRPYEVTVLDGVATTTLARTVADLSRSSSFEQSVAVGDCALALGMDPLELLRVLEDARGWPGVRQARRVADFIDGRSESVGESISRARCHLDLLPAPTLQHEVRGPAGELVGRTDFCWEEQGTLGEFDGKIKYGRLLRPGETIEEAVYREKLREDALRDLGWQVVRWTWADLYERGVIRGRLLRAFARAARLA